MSTSKAAQVSRLGFATIFKIKHTCLNPCSQASSSALSAVRSKAKCLQDTSIQPHKLCASYLNVRFTQFDHHLPVTSKPAPEKVPTSISTDSTTTLQTDASLVAGDTSKPITSPPSVETSHPPSIPPPADPPPPNPPPADPRPSPSRPSRSLAPFVAASPDLRRLVALGVDVSGWERRPGVPQLVLRLEWERDLATRVRILHDAGVPPDRLGAFISRNPLIFRERLEDLQIRLDYLSAKRFSRDQIASVVSRDPFWLLFSTTRIDRRLGLFQGLFGLSATELRQLAARCPGLITSNVQRVKDSVFTIREEFGFQPDELKRMLLGKPKVLLLARSALQDRLHFLHNEMGLSHDLIADAPNVLTYRSWRVRQRHLMLNMLNRDQYDRSRPGFVSLDRLVGTTDQEFCRDVAQVPVSSYNEFLKTL